MPTPAHTRVTVSGVFGGVGSAIEEWSWNLRFGPMQATTVAADQAVADQLASNYNTNLSTLFSSLIVRTRIRVANVAADGHVGRDVDGSYHQADNVTTSPGNAVQGTTGPMPLQVALACSLVTARPDATGKGRFFLPWPDKYALAGDFRLSTSQQTAIMGQVRTFLNSAVTSVGAPLVVASSKGYLSNVTAVRLGRLPDTQRSRRARAVEGYASLAL